MRTVANVKSHPIHPMLIGFPLTFLPSAFVCDLVGVLADSAMWWTVGKWLALAGIISALVAAVPGLIDYLYAVPPKSSGKKRATYHMAVNLSVVGLFIAAWILRWNVERPGWIVLLLEGVGTTLLLPGGWLGGTLVYRNFIGPDHRHARAGKWREIEVHGRAGEAVTVAQADELDIDQMKLVRWQGQRIALARTADGYYAFDDHCTHRGGSLTDGVLMCNKVQCLWHGSQFDITTGQPACGPAENPIKTYHVTVEGGDVKLTL